MDRKQMFVDGVFCDSESGETRATVNPATEEPIAEVPVATPGDTKRAIHAARRAFDSGVWSGMSPADRAKALMRVVERLKAREPDLAELEARDGGSTIRKTSMMDIPVGIEHFRPLVELGDRVPTYEPLPWVDFPFVSWSFVICEPIGVCAGIIPWNFPFMMAVWKTAPALIMGNTLVLRPASDTPLTALALAECVAEADLPPGVFNVLTGSGAVVGTELGTSSMVDKIALTGSTETGRQVMRLAADTVKCARCARRARPGSGRAARVRPPAAARRPRRPPPRRTGRDSSRQTRNPPHRAGREPGGVQWPKSDDALLHGVALEALRMPRQPRLARRPDSDRDPDGGDGHDGDEDRKSLCDSADGFSLHAARTVRADDRNGLDALCRYGLRAPPPIGRAFRGTSSPRPALRASLGR